MENKVLQSVIDSVRVLSAETIEKAKSGHPGTPLGAAPVIAELFGEYLKHNPKDPTYFDRDRFILSAGHASAMLYTMLHLCGYDITKEDLMTFRQLHSKLPGHPEYGVTPGVETSTGPLGQGISNAVGFALAEKILGAKFNKPDCTIIDHYTYAFCGDGCLMEGISVEATSLAGSWGLNKLIVIYDKNNITIEGDINGTFDDDIGLRFKSQGWHVLTVEDANDVASVSAAITLAKAESKRPTIIIVNSVIGFGSSKANSSSCHGAPLGVECLDGLKNYLGWQEKPFTAKKDTALFTDEVCAKGAKAQADWNKTLKTYKSKYPAEYEEYTNWIKGKLPDLRNDEEFWTKLDKKDDATRNHSGRILNYIEKQIPNLIGGSADLGPSNMTKMNDREYYSIKQPTGTNIHFGVREAAMASIVNGLQLHGGFYSYCSTFFVFSDYLKGSIRMSALMNLPVLYIFSHDSIGVGEDGPTHQPVDQLIMLRSIPNLRIWRPCDAIETASAYAYYCTKKHPTVIITSRQKLKTPAGTNKDGALMGGYIVSDSDNATPDVILMGTGSEVELLISAQAILKTKKIDARVVSMPCMEEFENQKQAYKESVLPDSVRARVAVEAGSSYSWGKYIGLDGTYICKDDFGVSAPASILFEINRFTAEDVAAAAVKTVKKVKK